MKRLALLLLSCIGLAAKPINFDRLVECIAQVEDAHTTFVGKSGERSRFQITKAVWEQHSQMPFYVASLTTPYALEEQYRVALAHVNYLYCAMENPSPWRIAAAWNGGLKGLQYGPFFAARQYADHVRNLYDEINP
jgi:hypothetical protein